MNLYDYRHVLLFRSFENQSNTKINIAVSCIFQIKKQSICTSKFIKIFEYNTCNCPAECRKGNFKLNDFICYQFLEKFEIVSHQYASLSLRDHRSMLSGRDFTILSLDLNQDEDEIITETDSASYNRFFTL